MYRDTAFSQGPVMPYVYAAARPVVERWGLGGGRVFTAVLGMAATLLAAALAARLTPRPWKSAAALVAFVLLACNVYHSYFTTVVKTYSLSGLLIVAGVYVLTHVGTRRGVWAAAGAGIVLALAAGVRLSAGVLLPLAFLYLLVDGYHARYRLSAAFALGSLITLMLVFTPFILLDAESTRFWLIEYHTLRWTDSVLAALVFKAGFLSRFVQAYFVAFGVGLFLVTWWWVGRRVPAKDVEDGGNRFPVLLWSAAGAVTFVHLAAPFPYDDYQVLIMPVVSAALAAGLVNRLVRSRHEQDGDGSLTAPVLHTAVLVVFAASVFAAFSSPLNQDWAVRERDRIWWRLKDVSDLGQLRAAGAWIAERTAPDDRLLTQDLYLAVEAGRAVPYGLEMGPFSYFPDWPRERAERLGVLNRDMMMELIQTTDAPVAAFSGYGLAIASPEVKELSTDEQDALWAAVRDRYREVHAIPHFGQAGTTLKLLELRK